MECAELFKKESIIVFVDLPKSYIKEKSKISFIRFEERTLRLKQFANLVIGVRKADKELVKTKILKQLGGIL